MSIYEEDIRLAAEQLNAEKFADKTVLVTGATGMIGGCVVDFFMELAAMRNINIHVIAVGRNAQRAKASFARYLEQPNFSFLQHDVCDSFEDVELSGLDYIVHAASPATPNEFSKIPVEVMNSNFIGISRMLELAKKYQARLLFVSSAEVYGNIDVEQKKENDYGFLENIDVRAAYPISKKAAETLCVAYGFEHGVETVICRLSHVYGPTMTASDNRASSDFLRQGMAGRDIVLNNDNPVLRTYTYVVDAVSAMLYVLLQGEQSNVYNVANPYSIVLIKEFADIVAKLTGTKVIVKKPTAKEALGYTKINRQVVDCSKLMALGWKPYFDINAGIEHTIKAKQI